MTAREVNAGDLDQGRTSTLTLGDWTLTAAGDGLLVTGHHGYAVMVPDSAAGALSVDDVTMPSSGAIGMLIAWPGATSDTGITAAWDGVGFAEASTTVARMGASIVEGSRQAVTATSWFTLGGGIVDDAFHSWVLRWAFDSEDEPAISLWFDGEQVASDTTFTAPTDPVTFKLAAFTGAGAPAIAYLGVIDGDVDVPTWSAGMTPTRLPMAASASWSLTTTATLTVGIDDDPAELPDVEDGAPQDAPEPPEPQDPPAGVDAPLVRWVSETMPSPTLDGRGFPVDWTPTATRNSPLGRFQIVVNGVDVTYWNDVATPVPTWARCEPFGSMNAVLTFPQITTFHAVPSWCKAGAAVDIRLVEVGGTIHHRFAGIIDDFGHSEDPAQADNPGAFVVQARGAVFADDLQLRKPAFTTAPIDIGTAIARELNATISRRHTKVSRVVTGCLTQVAGGWEPRVTGWVQQLLATAVKNGRQWTVKCAVRTPVIALKDTTTVTWSVHNGQRGVTVDLDRDYSQAPNAIYGEGINDKGGRWRNAKYPGWRPDDTPPYPFDNPTRTIHLGVSDGATDTGDGVSRWQRKAGRPVTGTYSRADRLRCLEVQEDAGITRDGIVGPQTWAATFGTGSNTGTLDCFFLPLAESKKVEPRRYGPDGDDLGPNSSYSSSVLRVERKIDFGQGVSKSEAKRAAREILARDSNPGWSGTVTLEIDPPERSRYLIDEGSNGVIRGLRGADVQVHVAKVEYTDTTVTLTVDTNARDYPTLASIRERERDAVDPAQALISKRLTKASVTDARATFDAESPAGQVPRFALFANLWSVIRVPFGSYGSIVRTELTTDGPESAFSVAVFDRPITAARLLTLVGNPLTASDDNPWDSDAVNDAGLLMSWGWGGQPCGYYPGSYSTPSTTTNASPLTGRMVDDASWEYASVSPPWVWVAFIASSACHVSGRFLPGVD